MLESVFRNPKNSLLFFISLMIYVAISTYISHIDVFSYHFNQIGSKIFLYNLCRFFFCIYYTFLVSALGFLFLRKKNISAILVISPLETFIIHFFVGVSLLTIGMLFLGYANLYYQTTAFIITLPLLYFSWAYCREISHNLITLKKSWFANLTPTTFMQSVLFSVIIVSLCFLFLNKIIYLGDVSNDVYEHYLPYQRAVIETHGIWPNDVWYQYYISKGAGPVFLAMLLTDPLAAASVSYVFFIFATLILYSLLKRTTEDTLWAQIGVLLFVNSLQFTKTSFISNHVASMTWLVCLLWLCSIVRQNNTNIKTWFIISSIITTAFTIYFPMYAIFSIPFLISLSIVHFLLTSKKIAFYHGLLALIAIITLTLILISNYFVSGLPLDLPRATMLSIANQKIFSTWCSNYLNMYFLEGATHVKDLGRLLLMSNEVQHFWSWLFRMDSVKGLFPSLLLLACLSLLLFVTFFLQEKPFLKFSSALPIFIFPIFPFLTAIFVPTLDSIYRNYIFMPFVLSIIGCTLWSMFFKHFTPKKYRALLTCLFIGWISYLSFQTTLDRAKNENIDTKYISSIIQYAIGKISPQIVLQQSTGLWQEGLEARNKAGLDEKIYFLNRREDAIALFSFPGHGLLTEPSRTSLGGNWHLVAFEQANIANLALDTFGLNYFLVDLNANLFGCIPFSPILSAKNLSQHFEIAWHKNNVYLLKRTKKPINNEAMAQFLSQWDKKLELAKLNPDSPNGVHYALYQNMKAIYLYNKKSHFPIRRPDNLTYVQGWEGNPPIDKVKGVGLNDIAISYLRYFFRKYA